MVIGTGTAGRFRTESGFINDQPSAPPRRGGNCAFGSVLRAPRSRLQAPRHRPVTSHLRHPRRGADPARLALLPSPHLAPTPSKRTQPRRPIMSRPADGGDKHPHPDDRPARRKQKRSWLSESRIRLRFFHSPSIRRKRRVLVCLLPLTVIVARSPTTCAAPRLGSSSKESGNPLALTSSNTCFNAETQGLPT